MNNIIITHADRDGLASAAVWLHEHSEIDQVIAIRDPRDLAATVRAITPAAHHLYLFDLPFSAEAAKALEEKYKAGSRILWIDHHLSAWRTYSDLISSTDQQRWQVVLPKSGRTTAARMVMEWLWLLYDPPKLPYYTLSPRRVAGKYEIPEPAYAYLKEVCGVGAQTDRILLLDAIEKLIRKERYPDHDELKRMLMASLKGNHALSETDHILASEIRADFAAVNTCFANPNPEVWDYRDGVVYVKVTQTDPLSEVPSKYLSMIAQKATGASISVVRVEPDWVYIGSSDNHRHKVDLMAWLLEIPGLQGGERMVGHPYVVSLKGFSIDGEADPVGAVARWLRQKLMVSKHSISE